MSTPTVWDEDFQCYVHAAAIADASGGTPTDPALRTALASANAALKLARITGRDTTDTEQSQGTTNVYDSDRKCFVRAAAIADPSGGGAGTVDVEGRAACVQVLNALRGARVIAHASFGLGGPTVWDEDAGAYTWSAYTAPTGAADITDANARTQVNAMAAALKSAGLLAQD